MTKTLSGLAAVAVLTLGAFGSAGGALAGDWADAVGARTQVSGPRQTADHSTDWTRTLRVENVTGTYQTTARQSYGFLEQALAQSRPRRESEESGAGRQMAGK